jgi:polygalacturonase
MMLTTNKVICYSSTPGAMKSSDFAVTLDGMEVFVEKFRTIHYVRFACSSTVKVEIRVNQNIQNCSISPKRYGIISAIKDFTVSFTLPGNLHHLFIKINDLEDFMLVADPPETDRPDLSDANVQNIMDFNVDNTGNRVETKKIQQAIDLVIASADKEILYFPKGCYKTGSIAVNGDMKIYMEDGSLIKGTTDMMDYPEPQYYTAFDKIYKRKLILVHNSNHFELFGRGVIDGEGAALNDKYQTIESKLIDLFETISCKNVVVRDVIFRNSSNWACLLTRTDDSHINNVKILNVPHHLWMDAFDVTDSENVIIENCFAYSEDDCFAIMTLNRYRGLVNRETRNIHIRNCTGWTQCSGVRLGWNSNELIDNVTFENVDFIYASLQHIAVHGLLEGKRYGNIHFENCRFESSDKSGVFCSAEGPHHQKGGCFGADLIAFSDCDIDGLARERTVIAGETENQIKELNFNNVRINGRKIEGIDDLIASQIYIQNVSKINIK